MTIQKFEEEMRECMGDIGVEIKLQQVQIIAVERIIQKIFEVDIYEDQYHDNEQVLHSPKSVQQAGAWQSSVSVSVCLGHSKPPFCGPMH